MASLQVIQNWEEWLMHQLVVLPFRGTSTGRRKGLTRNLMKFNKGKAKPCTRLTTSQQRALAAKASSILGSLRKSIARRSRG